MTITEIKYGKTYPLGNYSSERIDLTATLDEREHISEAFQKLKEMCDKQHDINNPQKEQEYSMPFFNDKEIFEQLDTITVSPAKKQTQEEQYLSLISSATSLTELKMYQKPSNKYPSTKELYQKKYNKLAENQTIQ